MKALARLLLALHCLLALSMPAHALAGTFGKAAYNHPPIVTAEDCHGVSLASAQPGAGDHSPQAGSLASHLSCADCLMCSAGCLPANLSSRTLALPDLLEGLVAHHPVLAIGLAPAPELKPPRN